MFTSKNISIKTRFLYVCMSIVCLSIAIFFPIVSMQIAHNEMQNKYYSLEHSSLLAQQYIEKCMNETMEIGYSLANNHDIAYILLPEADVDFQTRYKNMQYIIHTISQYDRRPDIKAIVLYTESDASIVADNDIIFKTDTIKNTQWYKRTNAESFFFLPTIVKDNNEEYTFSLITPINNPYDVMSNVGYVEIKMSPKSIADIMISSAISESSITVLSDSYTGTYFSSNISKYEKFDIPMENFDDIDSNVIQTIKNKDGKAFKVVKRNINITNWQYYTITPMYEIYASALSTFVTIFAVLLIALLVTFVAAKYFTAKTTESIEKLTDNIYNTRLGEFDYIDTDDCLPEMLETYITYNDMISSINKMTKQNFEAGQQLKKAEIDLLQSQINPHFLYNTLDLISTLSYFNETDKLNIVINSLIKFYRLSLHKGSTIVTVGDEIEHITNYVKIQNVRYENNINFEVNIPENILSLSIPKITLQPIIENAITHGIFMKENHKGTVAVTAALRKGVCEIVIRDDGVGIPPEKINTILDKSSSKGFGLQSTNLRLKLMYGDLYGITIKSTKGDTEVIIKIPSEKNYD